MEETESFSGATLFATWAALFATEERVTMIGG
jgi:hypothetical protein